MPMQQAIFSRNSLGKATKTKQSAKDVKRYTNNT